MDNTDKTVATFLAAVPNPCQTPLLTIQTWISEEARAADVGSIDASLKWQQPSYAAKGGTPIRLGYTIPDSTTPGNPGTLAALPTISLYVHCQSRLIETFRELYPATPSDSWQWIKTRELRLDATQPLPEAMIRQFILFALTYQSRKALPLLGG